MNSGRLAILAASLLLSSAAAAAGRGPRQPSAAPMRWRWPAWVALYSPLLSGDERENRRRTVRRREGCALRQRRLRSPRTRSSAGSAMSTIAARSCELTFKGRKQTVSGRPRQRNLRDRSLGPASLSDGAAGSIFETLSKPELHARSQGDQAEGRQRARVVRSSWGIEFVRHARAEARSASSR